MTSFGIRTGLAVFARMPFFSYFGSNCGNHIGDRRFAIAAKRAAGFMKNAVGDFGLPLVVRSFFAFPESTVIAAGGDIGRLLVSILFFIPLSCQVRMSLLEAVFFRTLLVGTERTARTLGGAVEARDPFVAWIFGTFPVDLQTDRQGERVYPFIFCVIKI